MRLNKSLKKTFSVIATIATLFNSLGAPVSVIAQEITPDPTPTETVQPTDSPTPTITPTAEPTMTAEPTPSETATPTPEATVEPSPTDLATPTAPSSDQPEVQSQTNENVQSQGPPAETIIPTSTVTSVQPEKEGSLTTTVVENIDLSTVILLNSNVDSPTVTTDKADYAPTDVVLVSGTGFTPEKTYTLVISSTDEPPVTASDSVTADSQGYFAYAYQLDGNYRLNYLVEVKDGDYIVASTTFTDGVATDIDQCQNGGVGNALQPCNESDFPAASGYGYEGNSNANSNNSHWNEGEFVPLRIVGTDYSAGAGNIQFSIDVTKGGKHAYDYVGSFDYTETTGATAGVHANHNNPVTDIIPTALPTNPDSIGVVPAATLSGFPVACGSNTFIGSQIAGQIKAWGTSGPLTVTYVSQNVGSSDCVTTVQVAWGATKVGFGGTIVIAYGAHIANQSDWGSGNSAISISGSPYHSSLVQSTTGGVTKVIGQQDAKLSANAVVIPGTINIVKNTIGGDGTFNYTTTGNGLSNFGITTISNTGNHSFTSLVPGATGGSRTVTETIPAGWSLTGLSCISTLQSNQGAPLSSYSTNQGAGSITVSNLAAGDTVTCTYTNTRNTGKIELQKDFVGTPENVTIKIGTAQNGSQIDSDVLSADGTDGEHNVNTGTYFVSETLTNPTKYTSGLACYNDLDDSDTYNQGDTAHTVNTTTGELSVGANEDVLCIYTNTRNTGTITVVKNTLGGNDTFGVSVSGESSSSANIATVNGTGSYGPVTVNTGVYGVSETSPTGWLQTSASCTKDDGQTTFDQKSFTVNSGDSVICTFTNTKLGTIIVKKVMVGGTDTFSFTGNIDQSPSTISVNEGTITSTGKLPGTQTVTEGAKSGWDLTSITCDDTNSTGDIQTGIATYRIEAGETITCTFTNVKRGHIIVDKVTDPAGDLQSFNFTATGSGYTNFSLADLSTPNDQELVPGTYGISESVPTGWDLTSATCDDGSDPSSIGLSAGEIVTCTFNNQKDANIIVAKSVVPNTNQTSFEFDPSWTSNFFLSHGQTNDSGDLDPGSYSVSEIVPLVGWDLTDTSCVSSKGDTEVAGALDLNAGETITCTFTNTQRGSISGYKFNDLDGDGVDDPDWSPVNNWVIELWQGQSKIGEATTDATGYYEFTNLVQGAYQLIEQILSGWTNVTASTLGVTLDAGESDTGNNFVNTQYGTITVIKQTIPDASNENFEFTASYHNENFLLTDGYFDLSGDLLPGTYSVSELPEAGWDLTSATCDDGSDPSSISLQSGENIICTFTNTQRGKIIVEKQTLPDGSTQSFDFTADYDGNGFSLTDGQQNDSGFLVAGTYSVSETVPDGWDLTSATCSDQSPVDAISLQNGETVTCVFTNTERGHLIVQKTTIPAQEAQVFGINATGSGTITGGGSGSVSDAADKDYEVTPGTYSVTETVPGNWIETSNNCTEVVIDPGETEYCQIVNTKRGNVTVTKYHDHNANGVKDDGDEVLGDTGDGAEIEATRWEIHLVGTDVNSYQWTGAQVAGQVTFSDLAPNTYTLSEQIKNGWFQSNISCANETGIDNDNSHSVTVNPGQTTNCSIGNYQKGSVSGTKYEDLDGSLDTSGDRSGILNWVVELYTCASDFTGCVLSATDNTDGNGLYGFANLLPGFYQIKEVMQDNWYNLTSLLHNITVTSGDSITGKDFVNTEYGTIIIEKQTNPDKYPGSFEFDSSWKDNFFLSDGGTNTTNNLTPGVYSIAEMAQAGWDLTSATCSDESDPSAINLESGETVTCTFTNTKLTDIHGYKWSDLNGDGQRGEEPLLGNWTIFIDENENGILDGEEVSTQTANSGDHFGWYLFSNLTPGTYRVCEVGQNGWSQTSSPACHTVNLPSGENTCTQPDQVNATENATGTCNFGNQQQIFGVNIEKSNDKSGGAVKGDTVTYTLVVTNSGNQTIYNLDIKDSLPGGFSYVLGTTTGGTTADPSVAGSNLTWNDVTDLAGGASFTISYQVKIADDAFDGTYVNYATCTGDVRSDKAIIDCNTDDSSVSIGQSRSYGGNLQGQVLGISTMLPATGSPTLLLIVSLGLLGAGLFLNGYTQKNKKTAVKKVVKSRKTKKHAKK